MKKYICYLKQLHNTAFTLLIIPGIESTATAQSADATSVSPPLRTKYSWCKFHCNT